MEGKFHSFCIYTNNLIGNGECDKVAVTVGTCDCHWSESTADEVIRIASILSRLLIEGLPMRYRTPSDRPKRLLMLFCRVSIAEFRKS